MKYDNAVSRAEQEMSRESSRPCCLTRVNSLLKTMRTRHDRAAAGRPAVVSGGQVADDEVLHAPTPHDLFVAELQASVAPEISIVQIAPEKPIAFDNPQELARARLVFSATLVVPLLLIASGLLLFDAQLGRASVSLLQFSTLALATPLILLLAKAALHSGWQGVRRHPLLGLTGAVAATGYATSAYAMSIPDSGVSAALTFSMAGLLAMAVHFGQWFLARKSAV